MLKMTMFFESFGQGWTETYYYNASDPYIAIAGLRDPTDANGILNTWWNDRVTILDSQAALTNIRIAVDGNTRSSIEFIINSNFGTGKYDLVGESNLWSVLLARLYSGGPTVYNKAIYLGGIPVDQYKAPETFSPTAGYLGTLNKFLGDMINNGFQIKSRPRSGAGGTMTLTAFTPDAAALNVTVVPNVLGDAANLNGFVILRGVKTPRGWNGVHKAYTVPDPANPGHFLMKIGPARKPGITVPAWNALTAGTVQPFNAVYSIVNLFSKERMVEHKRGRFFGQLRGHR